MCLAKMDRITLTIPERFKKCFDYAMREIPNDPEFKRVFNQRKKEDKRISKGKMQSVKIRFAINYYVINKIKELRQQQEKIKEKPS